MRITYKQMKSDSVLKGWSLVRGRFQGLLRYEVPGEVWSRLLELIRQQDPEVATMLEQYADAGQPVRGLKRPGERWSEAELEDRAVQPMLESLGWKLGETLERQVEMTIHIGSGRPKECLADFVGYQDRLSSEATFVLETKREIASTAQEERAVAQAESYAGKLRCRRFAVADPEAIRIYEALFPTESREIARVPLLGDRTPAEERTLRDLLGRATLIAPTT